MEFPASWLASVAQTFPGSVLHKLNITCESRPEPSTSISRSRLRVQTCLISHLACQVIIKPRLFDSRR
jgi:hypothetical protein